MSMDAAIRYLSKMVRAAAIASILKFGAGAAKSVAQTAAPAAIWTVPEIGALPDNANTRLVRRGRDLVTATYAHIGPEVADRSTRFAGNNLACGNCHLHAGTKKFGIPLFGLFGAFPVYSARLGAEITIEDRLNSCMTRSMVSVTIVCWLEHTELRPVTGCLGPTLPPAFAPTSTISPLLP